MWAPEDRALVGDYGSAEVDFVLLEPLVPAEGATALAGKPGLGPG